MLDVVNDGSTIESTDEDRRNKLNAATTTVTVYYHFI